jgi:thioesterase domain-containing protein
MHVFAMEQDRDELYREWIGLAASKLTMEAIVTTGSGESALDVARSVARALRRGQQTRQLATRLEHSSILPIQIGKRGSVPVYCVPGAGANVTSFIPLAEALGQDTAVTGLQPRGADPSQVPHTSVAAAAKAYVQEIMKAERSEAYSLLGHSFGGWVVFEMARLLMAAGRRVESLVMIDTQPPLQTQSRHYGRVDVLVRLIRTMEQANECSFGLTRADLQQLSYEAQLLRLTDRMKAVGLLPAAARVDVVRSLVRVFSVNVNTAYAPKHIFPGEILLVQAEQACSRNDLDPDDVDDDRVAELWMQYTDRLMRLKSAGNHMTMLKSPNVACLADVVRAYLNRTKVSSTSVQYV